MGVDEEVPPEVADDVLAIEVAAGIEVDHAVAAGATPHDPDDVVQVAAHGRNPNAGAAGARLSLRPCPDSIEAAAEPPVGRQAAGA